MASEFIRRKSPARYLKHRSDLEAEKWVTALGFYFGQKMVKGSTASG